MSVQTEQYYFNARWYDPTLGRYISEDPIRDCFNWYVAMGNNPVRFVDPTGLRISDPLGPLGDEDYGVDTNPDRGGNTGEGPGNTGGGRTMIGQKSFLSPYWGWITVPIWSDNKPEEEPVQTPVDPNNEITARNNDEMHYPDDNKGGSSGPGATEVPDSSGFGDVAATQGGEGPDEIVQKQTNPYSGREITFDFGPQRNPFTGKEYIHYGTDYATEPSTTPALISRRVRLAGLNPEDPDPGNNVQIVGIINGVVFFSNTMHNSEVLIFVNDIVASGDTVAIPGNSGQTTGPHIHVDLFTNQKDTDLVRSMIESGIPYSETPKYIYFRPASALDYFIKSGMEY